MSFQQKLMATSFLTAFIFGASWLLLAATILLHQSLDYATQDNYQFVARERGETIEVLKEPIKLCSHNSKSGYKNCIPLEIINSNSQNKITAHNSESSDSAKGRALYAVSWEATPEPDSLVSAINHLSLEAQDSVLIELQDQSSSLLEINDTTIPPPDDNLLRNDFSLLTIDVEEDEMSEFNNGFIELTTTTAVFSEQITYTEQLVPEDSTPVNLEATTANAQEGEPQGEGAGEHLLTESFYFYWFSGEETQE